MPLTFVNPSDYDKIESTDKISLVGLNNFSPGKVSVMCDLLQHAVMLILVLVLVDLVLVLVFMI